MLNNIESVIKQHKGEFFCEAIGMVSKTKMVTFSHSVEPTEKLSSVPNVGDLRDFYSIFGSLTLFFCPESNEAAFYIAKPSEWSAIDEDFTGWVDYLDEDEEKELLPSWFGSHLVIGEIPASGNYLLSVTSGKELGAIYEFEHDGFEFIRLGSSLEEFIQKAIDPDISAFSAMASHMRFTAANEDQQWWARELRHASGKVIRNDD